MDTQNFKSMKMISSLNKNLLSKAKVVWKTLVVLVLSVLLFAPTPALALDYNGTLQTYVSTTKVEIDGVLTSIKKLPTQSYENGKTTLAEIDNKLQKIQTDAGKNAKTFQNLSAQAQREYEQVLNQINQQDKSRRLTLLANQTTNLPSLTNASNRSLALAISASGRWGWARQPEYSSDANGKLSDRDCPGCRFPNLRIGTLVAMKNNRVVSYGSDHLLSLHPGETISFIFNDGIYDDNIGSQTLTYYFVFDKSLSPWNNENNYFISKNGNNVTIQYSVKNLESEKQRLANGIVLTNKISQLCDDLEKRVNLAKQKSGNVKEYADALNSFSEPDILTEIAELNTFVANLTKNLTLAT